MDVTDFVEQFYVMTEEKPVLEILCFFKVMYEG